MTLEQTGHLQISQRGIALIQEFEGCERKRPDGRYDAYPDPGSGGDPWTIGWGSTGPDIRRGVVWTKEQCDQRFARHLQSFVDGVNRAIGTAPTSQGQFDAIVAWHYNTGAVASATLTKKHKAGDFAGAAAEFAKWNKAGGKVMNGLTRRRAAERSLYQS